MKSEEAAEKQTELVDSGERGSGPRGEESAALRDGTRGRRRFIATALGAPLLLTVPTGAGATIAASSALACIAKGKGATPTPVRMSEDNWYRQTCALYSLKKYSQGRWTQLPGTYVRDNDRSLYVPTDSMYKSYGCYDSSIQAVKSSNGFCVVYVSDDGSTQKVYPQSGVGLTTVSDSCWCSFKA
jgi:hypothetical protein